MTEPSERDGFQYWVNVSPDQPANGGRLVVEGWAFHSETRITGVRVIAHGRKWPGLYNLPRPDVAMAHPKSSTALRSGFRVTLLDLSPRGELRLQARVRESWKTFFATGESPDAEVSWVRYVGSRLVNFIKRRDSLAPPYEGLEKGYVCWIDQPADWQRVNGGRFRVSGWCFSQTGELLTGLRAFIDSNFFVGRHGLKRLDVAASYGPRPGVLESGFDVMAEAPHGKAASFRLEVRHADGRWREVFQRRIGRSLNNLGKRGEIAGSTDYQLWIKRFDALRFGDRFRIRRQVEDFPRRPRVSILMPVRDAGLEELVASKRSVQSQIYPYWELCAIVTASTSQRARRHLLRAARGDKRITLVEGGDEGRVLRDSVRMVRGELVAVLEAGDILRATALYCMARELNEHPAARIIYTDEDRLDQRGRRTDPQFKPDWNWTLLLGKNYIGQLCAIQTDLIRALSSGGSSESEYYDLLLRATEGIATSQIRHIPRVLCHRRRSSVFNSATSPNAVQDHLGRKGLSAEVTIDCLKGNQRVRYLLPEIRPSVSLIIPTRDRVELLRACLGSILEKTTYRPFNVLVIDNGSKDPAALAYLEEIARDVRVRVLPWHEEFNYSQLNNFGVQQTEADFIALLNNDVIVISPDWLEELVSQATQPGVGAVAPRLLYPDERVQQAGVILGTGPHGVAEVAHKGLRKEDPGYGDRAVLAQELSVVGAACLVVKREIYLEVDGFDAQHLAVAFNDIDFCLKLRERGYRMIYTPFAELYHLEHASRGFENTIGKHERFSREIDFMKGKWGDKLLLDPAYNPNLSLGEELFALAFPPRVTPPWRQDRSK